MDLLTGYGSEASESEEIQESNASVMGKAISVAPASMMSTAALQQRRSQQTTHSSTSAIQQNPSEDDMKPAGHVSAALWAHLPPPAATQLLAPTLTSSLACLPTPTDPGTRGGARKVVTMQLPFHKELLAAALESDDEDEPAGKRAKTTGTKSKLMDFLPPPKHDTAGSARSLRAAARDSPLLVAPAKKFAMSAAPSGHIPEGGLAVDSLATADADTLSNAAYRVPDNDQPPHAFSYSVPSAEQKYAAHDYGPSAAPVGEGHVVAGPRGTVATPQGPENLIADALLAEQQRASKRGASGSVKLVEINAKDLTRMDPAAREAATSARDALGPEYALSLRRSTAAFEGSKLARRKHQIGTLLFNARMQELEQLDRRTQGQKSKAETAAKYGW